MVDLRIEDASELVTPGGVVSGTAVVETDAPIPLDRITVVLRGTEGVVHAAADPHGDSFGARRDFLNLSFRLGDTLVSEGLPSLPVGTTRLPFRFEVPSNAPLTVMQGPWTPPPDTRVDPKGDGAYVLYAVELRHKNPLRDQLRTHLVRVARDSRVLGSLAQSTFRGEKRGVSAELSVAAGPVTAGEPFRGSWSLQNPHRRDLDRLRVGIAQLIDVRRGDTLPWVEGYWIMSRAEQEGSIPSGTESMSADFEVPIPLGFQTIPAQAGTLYRSYWIAYVEIPSIGYIGGEAFGWALRNEGRIIQVPLSAASTGALRPTSVR